MGRIKAVTVDVTPIPWRSLYQVIASEDRAIKRKEPIVIKESVSFRHSLESYWEEGKEKLSPELSESVAVKVVKSSISEANHQVIDILLATYNGEKYIAEQIESILAQSNERWKLLVHDDGSTDGTVDIIKDYEQRFPDKIHFINDGVVAGSAESNFSHLMGISTSRYIMFCDQDDVWDIDKVDMCLDEIVALEQKHGDNFPILVHTDLSVVDEELKTLYPSFWNHLGLRTRFFQPPTSLNRLLLQNVVTGCTVMFNRELLRLALPMPKGIVMHDWWIALVASAFGVIHSVNQQTIRYRQHSANLLGVKVGPLKKAKGPLWKGVALFYALNRLLRGQVKDNTNECILQAEKFLEQYEGRLEENKLIILLSLINVKKMPPVKRRLQLVRSRLLMVGLRNNLILMRKI